MFHAILLCTVLVHILARPLPDDEAIISDLGNPPESPLNYQELEAWVAAYETMKDASLTKEERLEKLAQNLETLDFVEPNTVTLLAEANDYHWKLVNSASAKVKEVWNKSYDLKTDPKLYLMTRKERRAEGEKLYNTLSDAEKKEMKEIRMKVEEHVKGLMRALVRED
ncbi:hypothetical protein Y032_0446g1605 [Ancylostoma ceylanicum]|uniref:SXP/RAL-2 family protein Ani s 5-like cation-binding domain-containing protein n=2 Tax=Ancylostoma ceylanicum TaxID=53326 RepID=A0A016X060_9BILA|nr:hypothetical protein Y032_0446g1605 [Ancylostoma ceylanicum]